MEERARHLALSVAEPDEQIAAELEMAAYSVGARGGYTAVAELAERARELTPALEREAARRRAILTGEASWAAGDYEKGRTILQEMVDTATPGVERADALLRLSRNPRDILESIELCRAALDEPGADSTVRGDIETFLAMLTYGAGDVDGAAELASRAASAAKLRPKLTYANVVSTLCLFILLGGTSYAAIKLGKNSVKGANIANNAVSSPKVRNGSLLAGDFKAGQLPAGQPGPDGPRGPQGAKGDTGSQGAKGDTGTVDTTNFYSKGQSDSRFLAANGIAANSNQLEGLGASSFLRNNASATSIATGGGFTTILTVPGAGELQASCLSPAQPVVRWHNTDVSDERLAVDSGGADAAFIDPVASDATDGTVTGSTSLSVSDHVTYMVRSNGVSYVEVFDNATSVGCFFFPRAYG